MTMLYVLYDCELLSRFYISERYESVERYCSNILLITQTKTLIFNEMFLTENTDKTEKNSQMFS